MDNSYQPCALNRLISDLYRLAPGQKSSAYYQAALKRMAEESWLDTATLEPDDAQRGDNSIHIVDEAGHQLGVTYQLARKDDSPDLKNLTWHMLKASFLCDAGRAVPAGEGVARIDLHNKIVSVDDVFKKHILAVVPGWPAKTLPFPIVWDDALAYHGMTFGPLFIRVKELDDGYSLISREDRRLTLLSRREQEIVQLIAAGLTFKQAAEQLDISVSTVSTHIYRVYDKLHIKKRHELVEWLNQNTTRM